MQIKDVMSKDYKWIAPETTLAEAAKIMKDREIGFLPVGENDRLIGAITDRDIVVRALAGNKDPQIAEVRDSMSPQILYCFEDQDVDEICDNMSDIKVRRLPVVNRDKRLVGVVSLGDLSQDRARKSGETLQHITEGRNAASSQAA